MNELEQFISDFFESQGNPITQEDIGNLIQSHPTSHAPDIISDVLGFHGVESDDKLVGDVINNYNIPVTVGDQKDRIRSKVADMTQEVQKSGLQAIGQVAEDARLSQMTPQERAASESQGLGQAFSANIAQGALTIAKGAVQIPDMVDRIKNLPFTRKQEAALDQRVSTGEITADQATILKQVNRVISKSPFSVSAAAVGGIEDVEAGLDEFIIDFEGSLGDTFKNEGIEAGLKRLGQGVLQTLPSLVFVTATGGLGSVSAGLGLVAGSVAAGKLPELDLSTDLSEGVKLLNVIGTGAAEYAFESFGTGSTIRALYKTLRAEAGEEAAKRIFKRGFIGAMERLSRSAGLKWQKEGLEELGTTVTENFIDIVTGVDPDRNIWEGATESYIVGNIVGVGLGGVQSSVEQHLVDNFKIEDNGLQQLQAPGGRGSTTSQPADRRQPGQTQAADTTTGEQRQPVRDVAEGDTGPGPSTLTEEITRVEDQLQGEIDNIDQTVSEIQSGKVSASSVVAGLNVSPWIKEIFDFFGNKGRFGTEGLRRFFNDSELREIKNKHSSTGDNIDTFVQDITERHNANLTEVEDFTVDLVRKGVKQKAVELFENSSIKAELESGLSRLNVERETVFAEEERVAAEQPVVEPTRRTDEEVIADLTEEANRVQEELLAGNRPSLDRIGELREELLNNRKASTSQTVLPVVPVTPAAPTLPFEPTAESGTVVPPISEEAKAKIGDPARRLAAKIREGKISKLGGFRAGTGFDAAWDIGLEALVLALEGGASVAEGIEAGLRAIGNTDWYQNLTNKNEFDAAYRSHNFSQEGSKPSTEEPVSEREPEGEQDTGGTDQTDQLFEAMGNPKKFGSYVNSVNAEYLDAMGEAFGLEGLGKPEVRRRIGVIQEAIADGTVARAPEIAFKLQTNRSGLTEKENFALSYVLKQLEVDIGNIQKTIDNSSGKDISVLSDKLLEIIQLFDYYSGVLRAARTETARTLGAGVTLPTLNFYESSAVMINHA